MKKVYVWYSNATDITGNAIVEALTEKLDSRLYEVSGGNRKPSNFADFNLIIGYGTKIGDDVNINTVVLNHPNKIKTNRNKFDALKVMKQANVALPYFEDIATAIGAHSALEYPIVVRTNYHQGGRGLVKCASKAQLNHLKDTSNTSFGYAQHLEVIKNEYRVHVFKGDVIRIAKKVIQDNPGTSWKENYLDKIKNSAEKHSVTLDNATVDICLNTIRKDITLPDFEVRSNKHGWCFKEIVTSRGVRLHNMLSEASKNALSAIGLDFGAVDCILCENGNVCVLEINTGPGLQGGTLTAYVTAFEEYIKTALNTTNTATPQNRTGTIAASINTPSADRVDRSNPRRIGQEDLASMVEHLRQINETLTQLASNMQ